MIYSNPFNVAVPVYYALDIVLTELSKHGNADL